MNKNYLKCRFGCDQNENREHVFNQCTKLNDTTQIKITQVDEYNNIYKKFTLQINTIKFFANIEAKRKDLKEKLLPWGEVARTLAGTANCTMQQM